MSEKIDHEVTNITERPKPRWQKGKQTIKKVVSTVGAGIIGSVLTLVVVVNSSILPVPESNVEAIPAATAETSEEDHQTTQNKNIQPVQTVTSVADMVEEASKAVVGIVSTKERSGNFSPFRPNTGTSSGSGVLFRVDGDHAFIVTNNHVIEGADQIEISLENGATSEAEVVGADALTDLAVLKISSENVETVMEFGDSDKLRAGDPVVAIGNPLGLEFSRTVTQGIVSAVNRTVNVNTSAGNWDLNVIQTDAAINPGNSGGALVNMAGELIGINSLKIASSNIEGLGFAIPSNDAKPLIEEMITHGKIQRPYMGIGMVNLEQLSRQYLEKLPDSIKGGVIITSVEENSPADKAGLKIEDILVKVNDHEIKNANDLRKLLYTELKVGDKASLQVYRGGKMETLFITFTSYPEQDA